MKGLNFKVCMWTAHYGWLLCICFFLITVFFFKKYETSDFWIDTNSPNLPLRSISCAVFVRFGLEELFALWVSLSGTGTTSAWVVLRYPVEPVWVSWLSWEPTYALAGTVTTTLWLCKVVDCGRFWAQNADAESIQLLNNINSRLQQYVQQMLFTVRRRTCFVCC